MRRATSLTWPSRSISSPRCSPLSGILQVNRPNSLQRYFRASHKKRDVQRPECSVGPSSAVGSHGVFMGTVAARAPSDTTIDDIISRINPEALGKPPKPNATPSLFALLVTPSFAKHALDPQLPLQVLRRFHPNPTTSKPLNAIVAVVDRLPLSSSAVNGVEGIAYALVTDPSRSHVDSLVPLQSLSSTSKPGSLSFDMLTEENHHITAQMPLAQTIFLTGRPSTLNHTQYQFDPLSGHLRRQGSQSLESAIIELPEAATGGRVTLRAPLLPLTTPRRVVSSMGNIVRKLSCLPTSHKMLAGATAHDNAAPESATISASQELEAAVSRYFKLNGIAPEAVQVWALIIPCKSDGQAFDGTSLITSLQKLDAQSLEQIWVNEGRTSMKELRLDDLLPSLASGARLCKVLSGGGGWGKKAGLLSLDPDSQYSTRELRGDSGWDFSFEGDTIEEMMAAGRKQALGEIVKEGESIVFFLANQSRLVEATMRDKDGSTSTTTPAYHGEIVFGALPASSTLDEQSTDMPPLTHHRWRFGALCEDGMALKVGKQGMQMTQTKADIPHARLSVGCFEEPSRNGSTKAANTPD